jgi:hypothetical protein
MTTNRFLILVLLFVGSLSQIDAQPASKTVKATPVDRVWSGHPVGFDLLTTEKYQYVGYYNQKREMIIARRTAGGEQWQRTTLPSVVGWDSHNYITLTTDSEGFLHVSGNMHGVPLIYFRSKKPWEIDDFEQLPMTGQNEQRVTYPVFFKDQEGRLYFQYRNGGSGDGVTYWNRYDVSTKKWEPLFPTSIFDGKKEANAYMTNPALGPDGYFYIVWMWRLSPIANTNHNLSCMRSRDLKHWENMKGESVTLPVKWSDDLTTVDPVAPWNGLINMGFNISWDRDHTPYITYHKYDRQRISQVYISRWDSGDVSTWNTYQISDWKSFKWSLNKAGSLANSLSISTISQPSDSEIAVNFSHEQHGKGRWLLDKATLKIKQELPAPEDKSLRNLPPLEIRERMGVRHKMDNTGKYVMRWQTLPTNQDRAHAGPLPDPVDLVIYELEN